MDRLTKSPNGAETLRFMNEAVDELNDKSDKTHTHNYAGSSSVGGSADSAKKLDTENVGGTAVPVYFEDGVPKVCTDFQTKVVLRSWS